jgi:uncharacterized membrane protein
MDFLDLIGLVKFLYIVTIFFIVTWAIGFFFYSMGAIIHLLLVLAILIILIRFFVKRDRRKTKSETLRRERYM